MKSNIFTRGLYRIVNKTSNFYYRIWSEEQKRAFARCGNKVYIGKNSMFYHKNIFIGENVSIGENSSFIASIAKIYIGNNVMFGPNVTIRGGDHRTDIVGRYMIDIKDSEKKIENDRDVIIEDDVWIGCNVTILKGVHIGKGSIVGAGSIVVKDVPPYTIHVGCPDIKEKPRFNEAQIIEHERLLNKLRN